MDKIPEIFTWSDLKTFVNSLPDELLSEKVMWWGEEKGGTIDNAWRLSEDYVSTDYGCEPLSVQDPVEEGEEKWEVAYPKGTPVLYTDY